MTEELKEDVIIRAEDIILGGKKVVVNNHDVIDDKDSIKKRKESVRNTEKVIGPKGKPKSGRIWKEQKTRFSSIVKTRGIRLSFENKEKLRNDLKRVKEMSRMALEKRKADKEAKKQRRINNLKRAEENRKKSEVVQVIKNTAKLKKMKKKNLRNIEKRDTTNM